MSDQSEYDRSAGAGGRFGLDPKALLAFSHPAAILDPEGRIAEANAAFSAEFGLVSEDGGEASIPLLAALARTLEESGEPAGRAVTLPGRDGPRLLDLLSLPLAETVPIPRPAS